MGHRRLTARSPNMLRNNFKNYSCSIWIMKFKKNITHVFKHISTLLIITLFCLTLGTLGITTQHNMIIEINKIPNWDILGSRTSIKESIEKT